ncbi:hypothetical protein [Foetidibacter luteolus]|uniref:hypothetical protein n=1 Tax=Foetidibacter luteolus TaxID=2608880 RepID=UPI001A984AC5|nr:hypothetical protein [Foetidibacter luteolus]
MPSDADYEKAEMDQLRDALKLTHKDRFLMATTLYKVQQTMRKAKIAFRPYSLSK